MSDDTKLVTFHNFSFYYISNKFNHYDLQKVNIFTADKHVPFDIYKQETGWQYIPNQRMDDWLLPYQWYRLTTSGRAWKVKSCKATVQNMIPITEQVAIQGNASFSSFNNTIYALGFNDTLYDSPYNYNNRS